MKPTPRTARWISMERLRHRADFLAAATAAKVSTKAFVLQVRTRREDRAARIGFTVSRKVGNAVERNRVRRRLREMIRLTAGSLVRPGHDYVLVGRRTGLNVPFEQLADDFESAAARLHDAGEKPARRK